MLLSELNVAAGHRIVLADDEAVGIVSPALPGHVRVASPSGRPQLDDGAKLSKDSHPEIAAAAQAIGTAFLSPSAELAGGSETAAARLASAIVATAHGHAMLMLDGSFGSGRHAAETAAEQAAAATLALISGRDCLTPPADDRPPPSR